MSFLDKLKPKNVLHSVENAGKTALHATEHAGESVVNAGEKGLSKLKDKALDLLPDRLRVSPDLPPYTKLPPSALRKAEELGKGTHYKQHCIQNANGDPQEPVSMTVAASKDQLIAAMHKAGWQQPEKGSTLNTIKRNLSVLDKATGLDHLIDIPDHASPIGEMYMHGKPNELAFEKNDDHHTGRDHIRVFDSGKRDKTGRPIWEIASTRDTAFAFDPQTGKQSHEIDSHIDRERNMLMADLLKTGTVKNWHVAEGQLSEADKAHVKATYQTDGQVFRAELH